MRVALSSEGDGRDTVRGLKELEKLHRQVLLLYREYTLERVSVLLKYKRAISES